MKDVHEQRVLTKSAEEGGPGCEFPKVNDDNEEGKEQHGQATSDEYIGGRPDVLVGREQRREEHAEEDESSATSHQQQGAIADGVALTQRGEVGTLRTTEATGMRTAEFTDKEAYHSVGDGRNEAQQALGINGAATIEMSLTEDSDIRAVEDIRVVVGIAVAVEEDDGIASEKEEDNGREPLVVDGDSKERGDKVTQGETMEHTREAEVGEGPEVTVHSMVEPVNGIGHEEEQHRAAEDLTHGGEGRLIVILCQRESGRDSQHKEEEGEYEVARRDAVPLGVAEETPSRATKVVDDDHEHHGQTTQDIKRKKTFHRNDMNEE